MKKLFLLGFLSALFFVQCTVDDNFEWQEKEVGSLDISIEKRYRECAIKRKNVSTFSDLQNELNRVANCESRMECDEGQIRNVTVPQHPLTGSLFEITGFCSSENCPDCTPWPTTVTPQMQDNIIAQAESIAMEFVKCRDYQINYNFSVDPLACCPCSPGYITIHASFEIVCCLNQLPDDIGTSK